MGPIAYKLELPPGSQVHPVFHVALLKKCVSATAVTQALPTALTTDWELKVEPLEALAIRKNSQDDLEVLIRWKNLPYFENSWEEMAAIIEQFPEFHHEDKVELEGGSIDRDSGCNKRVIQGFSKVYKGKNIMR